MIEVSQTMQNVSQKRQVATMAKSRKLARAMKAVFGTGENLAFELAEIGHIVSSRTCNRWMACQSKPEYDLAKDIEDLIKTIGRQKARAILAHVEAVCGPH